MLATYILVEFWSLDLWSWVSCPWKRFGAHPFLHVSQSKLWISVTHWLVTSNVYWGINTTNLRVDPARICDRKYIVSASSGGFKGLDFLYVRRKWVPNALPLNPPVQDRFANMPLDELLNLQANNKVWRMLKHFEQSVTQPPGLASRTSVMPALHASACGISS